MDLWLDLAVFIGAAAILGALSARFVGTVPEALGALFSPWRADPLPHGVQEDDDFQWAWEQPPDEDAEDRPRRVETRPVRAHVAGRH